MSGARELGGDVSPADPRTGSPHLLQKVDSEVENLRQMLESLRTAKDELESLRVTDEVSTDDVEDEVTRLVQLYKLKEVLSVFRETKKLHDSIETCLKAKGGKSLETDVRLLQAVDHFHQLVLIGGKVFAMASSGNFLRDYLNRMLMFWYEELFQRVAPRFEKLCEAADWPVVTIESVTTPHPPVTSAFDNFFVALLKIEVRDVAPDHQPLTVCLPIQLMLKPFKKRFRYHFMGNTRTNQLDKPEWYMTQVLNWIKDNSNFLSSNVDPLLKLQSTVWPSALVQLTIGLISMIREKLESDLLDLMEEDKLFSHTVDEVYLFIKEVKSYLGTEAHFVFKSCDLFSVFLQDSCFSKILAIEKRQSSSYVDSILESKTAWSTVANDLEADEEDRKVPEAADNFIILLQSMIERCMIIQKTEHRQPFADLVVSLIEDFHLRLSQLVRSVFGEEDDGCTYWPFSIRYFAIINSMQYLIEVMEDWRCLPFIMESESSDDKLQSAITRFQHLIKDTLIPRTIDGFESILRDRISRLSDVRWFCLNSEDGSVDAAECEVILFISSALQLCSKRLTHSISDHVIKCMARQVNDVLVQDVLMKNTFNSIGADRIHRHVHHNLSVLFKTYITRPELFFAE